MGSVHAVACELLSGLRPDSFQGKANRFRQIVPDVVTLPQHFKNHGYFSQSIGKIYHGSWRTAYVGDSFQDPASWSVERWAASPQYYFSPKGMEIAREVFATASPKALFLGNAKRDPSNPDQWKDFFVRGPSTEAPDVAYNLPADRKIADAAIERLNELAGRDNPPPFFLAVGFQNHTCLLSRQRNTGTYTIWRKFRLLKFLIDPKERQPSQFRREQTK